MLESKDELTFVSRASMLGIDAFGPDACETEFVE